MLLQNLITINIISATQFNSVNVELIECCVLVLDIFHWINQRFKQANPIEKKEFYNDAVNNNLRLKQQIREWAGQTKIQMRNGLKISKGNQFNICSYHWIMNPHLKTQMLHQFQEMEWEVNSNFFLLQGLFNMQREDPTKFILEVPRDNIVEASLDMIMKQNAKDHAGHDPLKKPISIRFKGEPGIDEGGVRKEYFMLVLRELLNPGFAMFNYNEDV